MLFEAAGVILRRVQTESKLKQWAVALERRVGLRKATVALARKLAITLLSMWRTGRPFAAGG